MKEFKIEESVIIFPAEGEKPESNHVAKEIKVMQFPAGNQTLIQDNGGMQRDAVTLTPAQLLELIRNSEPVLDELKDAYVKEATDNIARGNEMLLARLNATDNEQLKTYLRSHIDRNQAQVNKAKGAFFTRRHDLYLALTAGIPAAITLLLARDEMVSDEALLEAFIELEKPLDLSKLLDTANLNPFKRTTCGGRRIDMFAKEVDVASTYPEIDENGKVVPKDPAE